MGDDDEEFTEEAAQGVEPPFTVLFIGVAAQVQRVVEDMLGEFEREAMRPVWDAGMAFARHRD